MFVWQENFHFEVFEKNSKLVSWTTIAGNKPLGPSKIRL